MPAGGESAPADQTEGKTFNTQIIAFCLSLSVKLYHPLKSVQYFSVKF